MRNFLSNLATGSARFRRDERGIQLVEVALVIPILLVLLAATAEFGRYFYYYATLSKATRAAVRHISSKPFTQPYKDEAIRLALCGSTEDCDGTTPIPKILPGLTAANIKILPDDPGINFPPTVTVTIVNYNYQPVFDLGSFVSGVSWTNVPVNASTTMRYMLTN